MKNISKTDRAYIAGFLDADGSIYAKIKPNKTYKYNYQITQAMVFCQSSSCDYVLKEISNVLNVGYLRYRNDGITEYVIGDKKSIIKVIKLLLPYLKHKQRQARLMIKILKINIKSKKDLITACRLVDKFGEINYSKKRIHTTEEVLNKLNK